jgi:hypothetical protein
LDNNILYYILLLIIYEYMMPKFPSEYIFSTILIAVFTGTILGTYIAFTIGFDFPLEKGFLAYIQTHIFFLVLIHNYNLY